MKPSKDTENHVKNLRELQFQNKLLNTNHKNTHVHDNYENLKSSDVDLILKTAVNRTFQIQSHLDITSKLGGKKPCSLYRNSLYQKMHVKGWENFF